MRIITATTAKCIATDFEHNLLKKPIEEIMERIFFEAMKGNRSLHARIPFTNGLSYEAAKSALNFFRSLDYTVIEGGTNGGLYFDIEW